MPIPLLTRVADDDVAFALTRRSGEPASRIGTCRRRAGRFLLPTLLGSITALTESAA